MANSRSFALLPQGKIYGIDLVKFIAINAMVLNHTVYWITVKFRDNLAFSTQAAQSSPDLIAAFIGFSAFILPATAGYVFRMSLDLYFSGNKLLNYPIKKVMGLALFLGFCESLKGAISVDFSAFFYWGALHFVGLSFVVIILLVRYSTNRLLVFSILVVALTPLLQSLAPLLQLYDFNRFVELKMKILVFLLLVIFTLVAFIIFIKYLLGLKLEKKIKNIYLLFSTLGLIFFLIQIKMMIYQNLYVSYSIWSLVFDIWITNLKTGNMWSFFPWFTTVALGFSLSHYRKTLFLNFKKRTLLSLVSVPIFSVLFYFSKNKFFEKLENARLFSKSVFDVDLVLFGAILTFFIILVNTSEMFVGYIKEGIFSRIIFFYSRLILPIYFIHFFLGVRLAGYFAEHFSMFWSCRLYPGFITLLNILLGLLFLHIFKLRKIEIFFTR